MIGKVSNNQKSMLGKHSPFRSSAGEELRKTKNKQPRINSAGEPVLEQTGSSDIRFKQLLLPNFPDHSKSKPERTKVGQ